MYEFTLILATEPDEAADRLYGIFDDGTLATVAGIPQIRFHRETLSLEEAIGSATKAKTIGTIGMKSARHWSL